MRGGQAGGREGEEVEGRLTPRFGLAPPRVGDRGGRVRGPRCRLRWRYCLPAFLPLYIYAILV